MTNKWKDGLPPIGEECRFEVWESKGCGWTEREYTCTVDFIGKSNIVISYGEETEKTRRVEKSYRGGSIRFMPIETADKIERQRITKLACSAVQSSKNCEDLNINIDCSAMSRFTIEALYDAKLLHDKKVEKLTRKEFESIFDDKCSVSSSLGWSINLDEIYKALSPYIRGE